MSEPSWRRTTASGAGRALARRVGESVAPRTGKLPTSSRVDPRWRRVEDGFAARLGPRDSIDVARPVGRWRHVDPTLTEDGWRVVGKSLGLGLWTGAVGLAWWLGGSRGRGPLASVAELHRFGEALNLPANHQHGRPAPPD